VRGQCAAERLRRRVAPATGAAGDLQLAQLLISHRDPLHADVRNLTSTAQTLSKNVGHLADTGHWASRLFHAAQRAVDYNKNWLRLNDQGQALGGMIMQRLELMYQPELASLSEVDRRRTLIALESLIDFESWGRMRELHGLSFEQACALWRRIIDRLLPSTPTPRH